MNILSQIEYVLCLPYDVFEYYSGQMKCYRLTCPRCKERLTTFTEKEATLHELACKEHLSRRIAKHYEEHPECKQYEIKKL